jgi:plastocyanin
VRSFLRIGGTLLVVLVLGAACSKSNSSSESSEGGGTIKIGSDNANDHGTKTVSGGSFELEADNDGEEFYFKPTILTGQAGQKVTLEVKNEGDTEHNFSIDDQKIDEDLEAGKSAEVDVTFPQSGVVEFYCKYHRARGMAGELKAS